MFALILGSWLENSICLEGTVCAYSASFCQFCVFCLPSCVCSPLSHSTEDWDYLSTNTWQSCLRIWRGGGGGGGDHINFAPSPPPSNFVMFFVRIMTP